MITWLTTPTLQFVGDDDVYLYVDNVLGSNLISSRTGAWNSLTTVNLSNYLVQGSNTLRIEVVNGGGQGGIYVHNVQGTFLGNTSVINEPFPIHNSGERSWYGSNGFVQFGAGGSYFGSSFWTRPIANELNGPPANSKLTSFTMSYNFTTNPLDANLNRVPDGTLINGTLSFDVAADNSVSMTLNGYPLGPNPLTSSFGTLTPISLSTNKLKSGLNTLTFTVSNEAFSPTGFLLMNGSGTYESRR
jgi:hypothetical protein